MMLLPVAAALLERGQRGLDRGIVALRAPGLELLDLAALGFFRHGEDRLPRASASGEGSLSMNLLTPTTICSPRSMRSSRAVFDSTSCCFM